MKTILEEKHLSVDGVIDRYPKIMSCIKNHHIHIFTKLCGPFIPTWLGYSMPLTVP